MSQGIIISGPASGSGKTMVTLGLLRALTRRGTSVRGAKSGPDYIDPQFHQAACGAVCANLDAWAMTPDRLRSLASGDGLLLIEGAMGLFDGAPPGGAGSTADLARHLELPVVLVVNAANMAQSVAPLVAGFARHDASVRIAGLILNNVGSPKHEMMLRRALANSHIPVLGAVRRQNEISHPSRHLGLVQASERQDLDAFMDHVADIVSSNVDLKALVALAKPLPFAKTSPTLSPPGQNIAIARDNAFAFSYPHMLSDWHRAGATLSFFSPLANQPPPSADFVFLPGGYPELHAEKLAAASKFRGGMIAAAKTTTIYGECGGYMVLGRSLRDAQGKSHKMLGLLSLETSYESPKLHLGYRNLTALGPPFEGALKAHEFHYSTTVKAAGDPLFKATDAEGQALADMGLRLGRVSGSFAHVIDQAP